jgi:hypothetical protein
MSKGSQDHQEQEANPQLVPYHTVQEQTPVHQPPSPVADAHRALKAPGKPTTKQVLALQRTVGNRAVQRMVGRLQNPSPVPEGTIQRVAKKMIPGDVEIGGSLVVAGNIAVVDGISSGGEIWTTSIRSHEYKGPMPMPELGPEDIYEEET